MNWTQDAQDDSLSNYLTLDTVMSLASLGISMFTARQERRHHHENKEIERKHHKVVVEMEKRIHQEQMVINRKSVENDSKRHKETVQLTEELHSASHQLERSLHQSQLCSALEQHLQDITSDLIVAGKEADRDMWDQRNAQFQTLLLSATVMFAAGMAVIVEGELPEKSETAIIIGYSASVGMSFAFLFVSIILCIRIVVAMSSFMYRLTNHHQSVVTNLVLKASDVMAQLFAIQEGGENLTQSKESCKKSKPDAPGFPGEKRGVPEKMRHKHEKRNLQKYNNLLQQLRVKRREINRYLAHQYLNKRFLTSDYGKADNKKREFARASVRASARSLPSTNNNDHLGRNSPVPARVGEFKRASSHLYLKTPLMSRQASGLLDTSANVPSMTEFEAFWHSHLHLPSKLSMASFYIGTTCLLFAISFLIYSR